MICKRVHAKFKSFDPKKSGLQSSDCKTIVLQIQVEPVFRIFSYSYMKEQIIAMSWLATRRADGVSIFGPPDDCQVSAHLLVYFASKHLNVKAVFSIFSGHVPQSCRRPGRHCPLSTQTVVSI